MIKVESKELLCYFPHHYPLNPLYTVNLELEDLKVLRRSPDLLNNVKIGHYGL